MYINTEKKNSVFSLSFLIPIIFFLSTFAFSATGTTGIGGSTANWEDDSTAIELTQQIQGEGLTITNPILRRGNAGQVGIFSNGIAGAKLEIDEGIILTAMSVQESFTTNTSNRTSINNIDVTADDDLLAIDNRALYDTVVLEFDVTLDNNTRLLLIEFQFASDEYNEYVGSIFNDTFGFFLSGGDLNQTYNIARVVDSSVKMTTQTIQSYPAVTVNNVNDGTHGDQSSGEPVDFSNTAYYIDNVGNDSTSDAPVTTPIDIEYDGITTKLQAAVDNLTPGVTYHFKMALADTGDSSWDTGVFVNKIIGLREPSFCFDYSYSQHGKYFTEDNNGSKAAFIEGSIIPNEDINVTIYIRNEEDSEIVAENITMDILDINATQQAIYLRNSTYLVNTGEVVPQFIPDSSLTVSDANITDIPYDDLLGKSYAYLYYGITPTVSDINISLAAQIHYDVEFEIGGGNTISQHYDTRLGTNTIPMCAGDNTKYEVDWGIFNVVSKGIYNYPSSIKYNIPTQTARQPEEVLVIAHDETGTDLISEINSTILVGVDLIDAGKFHSVKASCDEPTSAISPIVWMAFNDSPYIDLKQEITAAIADERILLSSINDYYPEARQNAAYRISYITTNDANESLVDTSPGSGGTNFLKLNNFTELVQDIHTCKQPVRKFSDKTIMTDLVPVACANAGNQGLSPFEYQRCMECLFGYNTKHICSRDNFAIRPESFNIKVTDLNQTDKTQKLSFATDRTGVASPSTAKVDITTGYSYQIDINATGHDGNEAVSGYTRYYTNTATDHNLSFNWDSNLTLLECNDIESKPIIFNIINGIVSAEGNITNVGDYRLNMIDKGWTAVDWDNTKMVHHGGANGSYFVQGADCLTNSSIVRDTGSVPSIVSSALSNVNGCDISTNNHDNSDANLKYRDYNITAHPYKFNLDNLIFSRSTDLNQTLNNSFLYTADVANDNNLSRGMALHIRGTFAAQGYNNTALSNFVTNCYAKDVNLTLARDMEAIIEPYVARFTDRNSTLNVVYDDSIEVNATNNLFSLAEGNFTKDNNGAIIMQLDLNFDRNITIPREPVIVTLNNFDVNCTTPSECQFQADLVSDKNTTGTENLNDANITHYYGRVHAPDYRFEGSPGNANIFYEVYCENCNQTLYSISPLESPDSIYWYQNDDHNNTSDGNVVPFGNFNSVGGTVTTTNNNPVTQGLEDSRFTSTSTPAVPNKDRVQMTPNPWLIYNRFDESATTNDFIIEFLRANANWAGEGSLGGIVDLNVSTIQNRRLDW